ncbi:aminodeoxychorismate lyase [Polymorphobacter glacialis]|uniref:Endolytic murein transglycosylase n=1 Tax=Sandarakinorhabdus glacialis TaxID=1614636 RepID=A0A917EA38_9SPHN|nr:endolytic transglycosylase MltG [Polymorphobacter glacialis]GGE14003.1 aminodeoxychorismate lyase [Polymorphobacter glacialis]
MIRRAAFAFIGLLLFIGLPLLVAPWFGWGMVPGRGVPFTVEKGQSLTAVAQNLDRGELIDAPRQFRILARLLGNDAPVQAGRYRLRQGLGWRHYLETLQNGDVERAFITIPEGLPSVMVADRLLADKNLTGAVIIPREGTVLPETYEYQPGESRAAVLARMQSAMTRTLADLWKARSKSTAVKSPDETIILASIVEKETGKASERRMVAGVYSNRLRQGIKLDADPTVIYPVTKGRPLGRRIRRSELGRDNGYNTYLKPGLPAGPIANPGRDSIAAVLNPEPTKALYFVADGSGGHVFAATLAEHNANVQKWYALRRQRGEM